MRLLLLSEGDAENPHGWSGTAYSLLQQLRRLGHTVHTGDVELRGPTRYLVAGRTFSPDRARWGVKFRLSQSGFAIRSRLAAAYLRAHSGQLDAIIQIGATFESLGRGAIPFVCFCDSNIRMAERGAATGKSEAASLTQEELAEVIAREAGVYSRAAGIFTLSERLRRSFIEDFGIPAERVRAIHAGPNLDESAIPRPDFHPRTGPPTTLFVGRMFERKGGDLLLSAFSRVRERLPDARLLIVGPDVPASAPPGVEFLGFLRKDEPAQWQRLIETYQAADVFCLPTRFEPYGIVFIEAMYFGLPCIGTDAWAIPEMVTEGETGYLVPIDDVDFLTERLFQLLNDRDLARRFGQAGRRRAETFFTWPAAADRMLDLLQPIAQGRHS